MQEEESLLEKVAYIRERARQDLKLWNEAVEGDAASAMEFEIRLASTEPQLRKVIGNYLDLIIELCEPIVSKINYSIRLTPNEKQFFTQLLQDTGQLDYLQLLRDTGCLDEES